MELIRLINSGEALAFVGSGISTAAGVVSWGGLYRALRDRFEMPAGPRAEADAAAGRDDLPQALELVARYLNDRAAFDRAVKEIIAAVPTPGELHKEIADWPFRLYVSANYDHLVDKALGVHGGGWVAVGNTALENRKVSGNASGLIWHVHGGVELRADASQLIVTESDYRESYPNSDRARLLEALARVNRFVFIGFGFRDEDFKRLLEAVGLQTLRSRPSFAILGFDETRGTNAQQQRDEIRKKFNVEVIPYHATNGNHDDLQRVINAYRPFIVRRAINYGHRPPETVEYDPLVTSLQVHNYLVNEPVVEQNADVRRSLARAWLLTALRQPRRRNWGEIEQEGSVIALPVETLRGALDGLITEGFVARQGGDVELSAPGREVVLQSASSADLARDQFCASLRSRVAGLRNRTFSESAAGRIVETAAAFLHDISRDRGLALAQNIASPDNPNARVRAAALLQELPAYFTRCDGRDEAFGLVEVVAAVLAGPRGKEAEYLGLLTQAAFGQHLLRSTSAIRALERDQLRETAFLLDSSFLIPALASASEANGFSTRLLRDLQELGCRTITTDQLIHETYEHARWALALVGRVGDDSPELLDAARGARGYRPNLFVEGFLRDDRFAAGGRFGDYMKAIFPTLTASGLEMSVVEDALTRHAILLVPFPNFEGFEAGDYLVRDAAAAEIRSRRESNRTFRHDRQTSTEAEVGVIVTRLREKQYTVNGRTVSDAFFLSNTRVIDGLPGLAQRIVLLPDGLASWLLSSRPVSAEQAATLFHALVWELGRANISFVAPEILMRRFSGLVVAARTNLERLAENHRDNLVAKYGPDPREAFARRDDFDAPFLAGIVSEEALQAMRARVGSAEAARRAAEARAEMTDEERSRLTKYDRKRAEKRAKQQRKERSNASSRKKGKGGKRRK